MVDGFDDRRRGLEEEYFRRKEQEALEKLRAGQGDPAETPGEVPPAAATTALNCPRCHDPLVEINYSGVKLDRCANCKGWWLDAGELEQITTRDDPGWFSRLWQTLSSK